MADQQLTESQRLHRMDDLLREYRHALLSRPIDTKRAQAAYSALLDFARTAGVGGKS